MDPTNAPNSSTLTPQVIQQLGQMLSRMMAAKQAPSGATPPVTQGMVGQVGGNNQGMPPIPFNTGGAAGSIQAPSPNRPQASQIPIPGLQPSYPTSKAAEAAVAQDSIGNIIKYINSAKQKKQQDESIKAENYFTQLMTASQNPSDPNNQKIIQALTTDPKIMKTIEKGLDYTFAQSEAPKKPEPPESHGLKAAFQKLISNKPQTAPQRLPGAGQPGGVILPGPTQAAQLLAQQQSGQLAAAKQSPEYRQQLSGIGVPPVEQAKLDTTERIAASKDMVVAQVAYEKSQDVLNKANADYQKQALANKGRVDASTATARINAQARVEAARIAAQASISRMFGKVGKVPGVAVQTKYTNMKHAQVDLDSILGGDTSQATYNKFIGDLKQSGLSGVLSEVPGQGGLSQSKMLGAVTGMTIHSDAKWKVVKDGLNSSISSYEGALNTSYPDWKLGKGSNVTSGASQSDSDTITVTPEDLESK